MQQVPFTHPFVVADLAPLGISRAQLRGWLERGLVRRVATGVFVPAGSEAQAKSLQMAMFGGSRVASFAASAQTLGVWTPRTLHPCHKNPLRADGLHGAQATRVGSLQVTNVRWTALNLARYQSLPEALIPLDSALRLGVTKQELLYGIELLPWRRGTALLREAVASADSRSESALESFGRGQMVVAQLPLPILQLEIRVQDSTYRADFAWPSQRVVVEADGEGKYANPDEERRERRRRNDLVRAGWQVVRYGWASISGQKPEFIRSLARLLN